MGIVTSIVGPSGVGKTRSFSGLIDRLDEVIVLRMSKKPFSEREIIKKFKKWNSKEKTGQWIYRSSYDGVISALKSFDKIGKKIIIVEDSTFLMTDYFMATAKEKGYEKFTDNAKGYYNVLKTAEGLDDDVRIYMINHIELSGEYNEQIKTIGKMLDEKIDIPSLMTVVLKAGLVDGKYKFKTNKTTTNELAKSPEGMFEETFIDNDLGKVDDAIKDYFLAED